MLWKSGQQLQGGKYKIKQELGEGGFGITYRASSHHGSDVVIKTLNEKVQRRPDFARFQQDFVNEAIKLAKCSHPHIVQIDEVIHEDNLWCIVMEYIDGENLAHKIENQGIVPEAEALGYIHQIGEALTVVHNHGLLHRDVKPQNIMLRGNKSEAVLIDFGIAREFSQNLTQTHTQMLADGFAPIEQYDKRAKRGAFTDVYALAATLYCLVTGEVPTMAPIRAIGTPLEEPKNINSSISDKVNQAILKGMEIKPENRPQSIQEWLSLLNKNTNVNSPTNNSANFTSKDRIIREFAAFVDYDSPDAGLLIQHKDHRKSSTLHYHITISKTHAFNFGGNGFAIFPIPRQAQRVQHVTLLDRKTVLARCLIAYELFKDWHYGVLGWNCEHFARLVTTGEAISYQVKESPLAFLNHNGYHPLAKEMMDKACKSAKLY
ncbi:MULTISPECIES: serine/threonine protein kinase [unclassified Calothrix]|uniref:serine/threonine protein kinase n=1 Tax=unclassified Calothrix TaxID=2619626 RepID=UPI001F554106|nr:MULTISPECIES: serine/threonine-protein kinase [unclassified Calothrix]